MSFKNRPGRSIRFIDRSIVPEIAALLAGLDLSSTSTSQSGRARRNAWFVIAAVFFATEALDELGPATRFLLGGMLFSSMQIAVA